jgi:eukaryotic-like serine/threonine-protein kinase
MGAIHQRRGRNSEAVASCRESLAILERRPRVDGHHFYALAFSRSLHDGMATEPGSGLTTAEARAEADRALDDLRQAVAHGYCETFWMRIGNNLDPLRSRPDFQLLMMNLAMPVDPFAR